MKQRTFAFQGSGPGAAQAEVRLWCREPPEAQAGKTLTWQLDGQPCSGGQQPSDGAAQPAAAPATADADPDLIGLDIWPASIALCRYLANHPELVAGQHVLELGAGGLRGWCWERGMPPWRRVQGRASLRLLAPQHASHEHSAYIHHPRNPVYAGMGLVGLLCAALGAQHVLLTDYEPQVLAHLQDNAALNGLQQRCASLRLDWRQPAASLAPQQQGSWRRVVAADVLYASAVVQPLISTLSLLLHPEGALAAGLSSMQCPSCFEGYKGMLQRPGRWLPVRCAA